MVLSLVAVYVFIHGGSLVDIIGTFCYNVSSIPLLKDEDAFTVAPDWKPPLPDLSPEMCESKEEICPCPHAYLEVNYTI